MRARIRQWRRPGATLIELLVVVALIGMLVSMLVPSLKSSMNLAAATICKHNLREIGHAITMYQIENDGWLPATGPVDFGASALHKTEPWFAKLYPNYLDDPQIFVCPEDPYGFRMTDVGNRLSEPEVADYASFGINGFIMSSAGGSLARIDRRPPSRPLDTMLLADIGPDRENSSGPVRVGLGPFRNASLLRWDDGFDPFAQKLADPWLTLRHPGGINALTLDGGVREAQTAGLIRKPIRRRYRSCAAGGCTFCNNLQLYHYSFAADHLYWWTGAAPSE